MKYFIYQTNYPYYYVFWEAIFKTVVNKVGRMPFKSNVNNTPFNLTVLHSYTVFYENKPSVAENEYRHFRYFIAGTRTVLSSGNDEKTQIFHFSWYLGPNFTLLS